MAEIMLKDDDFLVSETDKKGVIRFANEDFCRIAQYTNQELIGKPHNIVRHPDMPKAAFKDLWDTIKQGKIWTGFVKNKAKSGDYYWVFATVYPLMGCGGSEGGYMSCRRKASREEIAAAEKLYKTLR
jgi:aerotaxis receptor